ncbi:MAG TPA: putative Ig domain-containing protein [Candidatus Acidoferrales bacterium]|jgi:putative Ig domain-containing protein|nr:putative Ig domain-containing protein [Candidatus Acidoferrales bacterium]
MSLNTCRPANRRSDFIVSSTLPFLRTTLTLMFCLFVASSAMFAGSIAPPKQLTLTGNFPVGVVNAPYQGSLTATGGTAPYTYSAPGLPKGLTCNATTGGITGKVTTAGQTTFTAHVKDSVGDTGEAPFTLTFNNPPISVTVAPKVETLPSGGSQEFLATVLYTTNTAVTWTASAGTIDANGNFYAPKVTVNTAVTITATSVADTTKSGTAKVTVSTVKPPKVALELLFPPTNANQPYYADVQKYLLTNNPTVAGVDLWLEWSSADLGPTNNPQYNFSAFDAEIAPFIAAGKKVNIIVWAVADLVTNTSTPQYVWNNLGASNITTCAGEQIPNYFNAAFQVPYMAFMAQVIQHYGSNASVGYIRMGLGRGGETFPSQNFGNDPCTQTFENDWGWSDATWEAYVDAMVDYEVTLNSPKQLMIGLDTVDTYTMADIEAANAVPQKVALGNEGLEQSDITKYPICSADWCNLWTLYKTAGVPLELQTIQASDPTNNPPVGSLTIILPFAVEHGATIMEIYTDDWLQGFDPNYPNYATYGAAYAAAIKAAAQGK